jgi:phosphonate degradation associated HDIG domain protein
MIESIVRLYAGKAGSRYGTEAVSQLEHALQCAGLALAEDADTELVAAAFLHDIGHLVAPAPHGAGRNVDDLHQYLALAFLRGTFAAAVLEPIKLHVDAKRYLCRAEEGYWEGLSPASQHSLRLQGGIYSEEQAAAFAAQPFAADAIRLRRWDEAAKVPGAPTPHLGDIAPILAAASERHRAALVQSPSLHA